MTTPTTPSGADAAGARNRAAVEQLEDQAAVPVRVAIYAVLARLLEDLGPGVLDDGVTPTVDAATVAARSAWSTVVDRITAWVRSTFTRLLTRAADNLDDLAPEIPAPALEDRVSDLVDQLAADLASVPDTVASRVATTLRDGYEAGDTPQELRQRVAAVLDRDEWDDEVVRIARTTTTTVYNAAHTAAANELERSLGRPLQRMWIATQDTRTRPTHRRAHAQIVESGERFRVGEARLRFPGDPLGSTEEIVNCFPGGTRVEAFSPVVRVFRRWYEGAVSRIEASDGVQITVTPNHPILTDAGWKSAQDIQAGDKLVCSGGDQWRGEAVPQVDDMPPTFEQVYRAATESAVAERIVGRRVVFHGDVLADDQVDVVTTLLDLRGGLNSPCIEHRGQDALSGLEARPGALAGACPGDGRGHLHRVLGAGVPTVPGAVGLMGARCEGLPLSEGHAGHSQSVGLTAVSDVNASLLQSPPDDDALKFEALGQREFGLTCGVPPHDLGDVNIHAVAAHDRAALSESSIYDGPADPVQVLQILDRSPGGVATREVVRVSSLDFRDHVFNLETVDGWYVADSTASSNCRCVVVPVANDMVIDLAHRVTRREAEAVTEPIAAATQVTDTVITDLPDEFDVDESDIPGITAEDGEPDEDGRWPIDADDWPDLDAEGLEALSRIPPQLRTYWTTGEGAARIRWGTEGSFRRCQRALARYVTPAQLDGLCANLYHAATGRWPGQNRGDGETAGAPCGCGELTEDERAEAAAFLTAGDWRAKVAAALDIPVWMLGPLAGTVSGATDLPIADRDREWDGDAAADRVRTWATTDGDEIDVSRYGRAFFYRDPDAEPDTEAAYKLGFADVVDGELTAIPAGLFAVASVLQGGRGGVDIPEVDQEGIRTRVGGYYRRMAEQFDDESLTPPWDTSGDSETDGDMSMDTTTAVRAPSVSAANLDDARTGAMIALVPAEADATRLAVAGDEATTVPAAELHTTLLFLGEGADWAGTDQGEHLAGLVERLAVDVGPITGTIWQAGATGGDEPTAMYLVGDDTGRLAELHTGLMMAGGEIVPPQHSPYVAHISTRYGDASTEGMDQIGTDVTYDRMRVSYGSETVDYPLTGDTTLDLDEDADDDAEPAEPAAPVDPEEDEMTETATATAASTRASTTTADGPVGGGVFGPGTSVTIVPAGPADTGSRVPPPRASIAAAVVAETVLAQAATNAPERPPAEWFRPVAVAGPTPPTVTAEGRVWGHIGQSVEADGSMRCHVGITEECVPIPPTRTAYGAFHRGEIATAEGDMVAVGYLYTGCDHSDLGMDLDQARGYLDAACTRTAAGRVYDTDHGPMFVGSLMPGVTARNVAQLWKLSGEWFTAPLELHAAVGVDDAGFPVDGTEDMVRVAEAGPEPLAANAHACACPAGDGCPCATVTAATPVPDNDGAQRPEPGDSDDEGCECPEDAAPEDCECPGSDDDAPAEDDMPVRAVAEIDNYRAGRARHTTTRTVNTAANRRARRQLGTYDRRG